MSDALCPRCKGQTYIKDPDKVNACIPPTQWAVCKDRNCGGRVLVPYEEVIHLELYPEIHCDSCNDVVHNHFTCPICCGDAGTKGHHYDLGYHEKPEEVKLGFTIECYRCHSRFKLLDDRAYGAQVRWTMVHEGTKVNRPPT